MNAQKGWKSKNKPKTVFFTCNMDNPKSQDRLGSYTVMCDVIDDLTHVGTIILKSLMVEL